MTNTSKAIKEMLKESLNTKSFVESLKDIGIQVLKPNGEYRNLPNIFSDLQEAWDKLDYKQKEKMVKKLGLNNEVN